MRVCRRITRGVVLAVSLLTLTAAITAPARAQQATPSPQPTADTTTLLDLAKDTRNPVVQFIKVPFLSATGFEAGPHHNAGESLNIQPVLPLPINADWSLITRPSLSLTYLPSPDEHFGLQDLQVSFFVTPAEAKTWLWGVGLIFQFPSASAKELGTGRWSAGPTAALIYSEGSWFNGVLAYQLMSFAGDRDRGSVNQTYIEPLVSYNFESGWYVQCDPSITFDWTADSANGWMIPMGADFGKAFDFNSQAMSLQVGSYDFVKHPDGAPRWMIRVQLTFLFPSRK